MNISSVNNASDARRLLTGEIASSKTGGTAKAGDLRTRQVATAAGQFEAIILRQMLTPAIEPLMNSGLGQSGSAAGGGGVYGYMLTDVLADSISKGGGMGLSKMLQLQLSPKGAAVEKAAATYASGKVTTHE